jgi:hypothetical protein
VRQFSALHRRLRIQRTDWDYRFGVLAAAAVNSSGNRKEGSPPLMPYDFFPSIPQPQVAEMTPEQALRQAKLMEAQFARIKFS